jgi:SAM-dependent methyltransferase
VADVGGGPGRYTDWLVEAGHEVVHRDLVADHVAQVAGRHPGLDTAVGDARALDLADGEVDAVLLLGPLYHLRERSDRVQALREAARVARPGAPVFAAAISRWAARLDGFLVNRVHLRHPVLVSLVDEAERSGWLPPVHDGSFTCHTHRPDELRDEVAAAGLTLESLVTVEGPAFALGDIEERMADPVERALVLDTLRAVESVPELLGVGPHLLATVRRPA